MYFNHGNLLVLNGVTFVALTRVKKLKDYILIPILYMMDSKEIKLSLSLTQKIEEQTHLKFLIVYKYYQ